ncbi:MAG TPA: VOC family protein [Thermomicrobiales bacterium]|nr:VOC family protein [Thermomicrobiales bacterium]
MQERPERTDAGVARGIGVDRLDHLVLTVRDLDATCAFYTRVLGMTEERFAGGRRALRFGAQKLNLHQYGHEFEPKAAFPMPGSADLCFIVTASLEDVLAHLAACGVTPELGPVERTGALGPIRSLYLRDPDGNLLELSNYGYQDRSKRKPGTT